MLCDALLPLRVKMPSPCLNAEVFSRSSLRDTACGTIPSLGGCGLSAPRRCGTFNKHGRGFSGAMRRWKTSTIIAGSTSTISSAEIFKQSLNVLKKGFRELMTLGEQSAPSTSRLITSGNFGPVDERIVPEDLTLIHGAIPADFPTGIYVRNGPNPAMPAVTLTHPVFGRSNHHWFEGDGMLHSTAFRGPGKSATYMCRYVETEGLKMDLAAKEGVFRPTIEAEPVAMIVNFVHNRVLFGAINKNAANTSVVVHSGRVLCTFENAAPTEVLLPSLETVGLYTFDGALDFNFSAHPKIDPVTGEMVIFGYSASDKPYLTIGVVSKEGKLVHKVGIYDEFDIACLTHDLAITERYTVIPKMGLTIRPERLRNPVAFEKDRPMRFGVMPRFGNESSIRWFDALSGFVFHFLNAYEDGDWVVIFGCRMPEVVIGKDFDTSEEDFYNYLKGSLGVSREELYEWRLNMKTGEVRERSLVPADHKPEFPTMNPAWVGRKNEYGYAALQGDPAGGDPPKTMGICKYHLPQSWEDTQVPIEIEYHIFGPNRFGNEAVFVPREGGVAEDDGWLVSYVHDEGTGDSEVYIIDAQNFEGPPAARLKTSRRIPYGLHGAFVPMQL